MNPEELAVSVEDVVDSLVAQETMFTAFDVTKLLRAKFGKDVNISHNQVRNAVHKLMEAQLDEDYEKSNHTFMVGTEQFSAQVYHPYMAEVKDYNPAAVELPEPAAAAAVVVQANVAQNNDAPAAVDQPAGTRDSRGRLLIPTAFIKHLGQEAGQFVSAYKNQNCIVLSALDLTGQHELISGLLQVDKHGYCYLSTKVLKQGNIEHANAFSIETNGNIVEIRPL